MRHSVTTPGGFFIGIGGIVVSLFVAYAVYTIVRHPSASDELHPQQIALGLAPKDDATPDEQKKVKHDTTALLEAAAAKYNDGKNPNVDELEDLRGVIRYREAQKTLAAAEEALHAPSNVNDKDGKPLPVLAAAKQVVVSAIQVKKPTATAVKVDLNPPAEKIMPPPLPNLGAGGVNTVVFPHLPAVAAPAAAPAATPAPATPAPAAPAPNRPPLLNGTEPTK